MKSEGIEAIPRSHQPRFWKTISKICFAQPIANCLPIGDPAKKNPSELALTSLFCFHFEAEMNDLRSLLTICSLQTGITLLAQRDPKCGSCNQNAPRLTPPVLTSTEFIHQGLRGIRSVIPGGGLQFQKPKSADANSVLFVLPGSRNKFRFHSKQINPDIAVRVLGCGGRGIRTPGGVTLNSFQDCRIRPLCHSSKKCLIAKAAQI